MTGTVLVTYGTTNGSTARIAEAVADALRGDGLTAEVRQAGTVASVTPYEAVVVGGGLYAGRWHKDARRFVRRYDPNCYLYLSRSMDWFDLGESCGCAGDTGRALASIRGLESALVVGVETDILFPLQQQGEIAEGLRAGGCRVEFRPMPSPQGHDAFLVDAERFGPAVGGFLTG